MCGIVGILSRDTLVDPQRLAIMRESLTHRGPDDAGLWCSDDRRVGLAHRRLAILDLSPAGHQPMRFEADELTIVFNGEIYNFSDLKKQLADRGVTFRSSCDTEVLLAAYRQWGADCLNRLEGMFALAIHDGRTQMLLLARDRAGEKPLYYHHDGQTLRFASELKALLADPAVPRRLDPQSLNYYLAFGYVPADRCMLVGLAKLPAGSAMQVNLQTLDTKIWRYWDLPVGEPVPAADEEELIESLHHRLRESVRQRLVADVPVGIMLSGGVDSSLVTAVAAEVSSAPVRTFTVSFPGHGVYDEAPHARRVAEHFGTQHEELVAEPASVELLEQLAHQFDEPMADSSMVPTYLVSRAIRDHATVALGGDGGDELFGGYPGHRWVQQWARWRRWLPRPVRRLASHAAARALPAGTFGRNGLLGLLADADRAAVQVNLFLDARDRAALISPLVRHFARNDWLQPERWKRSLQPPDASLVQAMTAMDFRSYLPEDILVKVDRASMATSLEVRAPFLDSGLIAFAFNRVPDFLRATAEQTKVLPKRLARRLLPETVDLQRKQGFSLPLDSWFRGPWGAYCRDVLSQTDPALFDGGRIEQFLQQQRCGAHHTQRLFALTMFELWRREYRVQLPGTDA